MVVIEITDGVSLSISPPSAGQQDYPTSRIQKGLVLACGSQKLVEEGLGFGVPLVKYGPVAVFPGDCRILDQSAPGKPSITARYTLNLVETVIIGGRPVTNRGVQRIRDYFGALHRKYPSCRPVLMRAFRKMRQALKLETRFEPLYQAGEVAVDYVFPAGQGIVQVQVNLTGLKARGCTQVIMANEQGGNHFDRYRDSNGLNLQGSAIGTWDETTASEATLLDLPDKLAFTLYKVERARMLRGRELEPGRLAWSGLNYVFAPQPAGFSYDISISKLY